MVDNKKITNDMMVVASSFGVIINNLTKWLEGNGIGQSIVKWGGLATAITGVTLALIHYLGLDTHVCFHFLCVTLVKDINF